MASSNLEKTLFGVGILSLVTLGGAVVAEQTSKKEIDYIQGASPASVRLSDISSELQSLRSEIPRQKVPGEQIVRKYLERRAVALSREAESLSSQPEVRRMAADYGFYRDNIGGVYKVEMGAGVISLIFIVGGGVAYLVRENREQDKAFLQSLDGSQA